MPVKTMNHQVRQIKENHVRYRRPKPSIILGTVAAVVVASPLAVLIGGSAPTIAVDPSEPPAPVVSATTINQVSLEDVPTIVLNLIKSGLADAGVTLPPVDVSGIDLPDIPLQIPPGLIPSGLIPSEEAPSTTAPGTGGSESSATTPSGTSTPPAPGQPGAGTPEGAVVKEVSQDTPFSMVGLTWEGLSNSTAHIRAKQPNGQWGPWVSADAAHGPGNKDPLKQGTEPVWVGNTTAVQIAVTSAEGVATPGGTADPATTDPATTDPSAAQTPTSTTFTTPPVPKRTETSIPTSTVTSGEVAPRAFTPKQEPMLTTTGAPGADPVQQIVSSLSAALITPGTGSVDPATGSVGSAQDPQAAPPIPGDATDPAAPVNPALPAPILPAPSTEPQVITRAQWGADEGMRCSEPQYDDTLKEAIVHHTAGSNDYTREQSAEIVRGIYAYHAQTLGWCDIGYNVLVDKYGQIFEGRAGGLDRNVQGAHTGGFNEDTVGLAMMGDLNQIAPTPEMVQSVGNFLGWRLKVAQLDPRGQGTLVSQYFDGSRYGAGEAVTMPTISGHRDFGNTECPGTYGYEALPQIRDIAAGGGSAIPAAPAPVPEVLSTTDQGAIAQQWVATGGPTGTLGNATTVEQTTPDGTAKYADFENGKIYWSEATGAQVVQGAIAKAWAAMGFENSSLGLPTSPETTGPEGVSQTFQGGTLFFNLITGIVQVLRTYIDEFTNSYNEQRGTPAPAPTTAPAG